MCKPLCHIQFGAAETHACRDRTAFCCGCATPRSRGLTPKGSWRQEATIPEVMKIAKAAGMTAPVLYVHWGEEGIRGSERVLLDLLKSIDRRRFTPILWCNAETMASAARALDVQTRVSPMPILLGWDAPRLDIAGYRALVAAGKAMIREFGVHLVHANSGAPNQWMVPATRSERVPMLAHLHAIYGFRERCTLLLHQVSVIVGCSDAVVRPFRADGIAPTRLRVIYNGVDTERLSAGDARGLRASLGVSNDAFLIVGVGALVRLKGFDTVIRALGILSAQKLDAHLAIVGEGPEREALVSLSRELGVENRVHFLGDRSDVGAILRDAADVVAVGSSIESFGLVAAEAGAAGRAVVATRVGGMTEVIQDTTGLLVAPGDPAAFAAALSRLARDQGLRTVMGRAGSAHVLASFTAQRAARSFETLYAELEARPRADFGWSRLGLNVAPFARLGFDVIGRRLGARIADA
jgi:glycosyltransferase involved in cell wall biosynthesis